LHFGANKTIQGDHFHQLKKNGGDKKPIFGALNHNVVLRAKFRQKIVLAAVAILVGNRGGPPFFNY
jgi:hypothetical protein